MKDMKYDVIGDIHGCYDEMTALLEKLGYSLDTGRPLTLKREPLSFSET